MAVQGPTPKTADRELSLPTTKRTRTQPHRAARSGGKKVVEWNTSSDDEGEETLPTPPKKKTAVKKLSKGGSTRGGGKKAIEPKLSNDADEEGFAILPKKKAAVKKLPKSESSTKAVELQPLSNNKDDETLLVPPKNKAALQKPSTGEDNNTLPTAPEKKAAVKKTAKGEEKRLRQYRDKAPKTYLDRLARVITQRMFVISRTRTTSPSTGKKGGGPTETIDLAGSTGNIYTITISREPRCTCPDNKMGKNQCKHIVYVLHNVLKAPEHLQYQLAFLTSELEEIFSRAPLPSASGLTPGGEEGEKVGDADGDAKENSEEVVDASGRTIKRKPLADNDCPICFMAFEAAEKDQVVWCRAACGNNVHASCFEQWARAQQHGREVRCVFCRSTWMGDDDAVGRIKKARERGVKNMEGYVNVADELGISRVRDTSTYHDFWVRQQVRRGATFETE